MAVQRGQGLTVSFARGGVKVGINSSCHRSGSSREISTSKCLLLRQGPRHRGLREVGAELTRWQTALPNALPGSCCRSVIMMIILVQYKRHYAWFSGLELVQNRPARSLAISAERCGSEKRPDFSWAKLPGYSIIIIIISVGCCLRCSKTARVHPCLCIELIHSWI